MLLHPLHAAPPAARSDAAPQYFQVQPGEFPPDGSAKPLAGELIALDHINRKGILRVDREDEQTRTQWDRPHPFELLPYATIMYQGAPAALRDIPIGTHLHADFYDGPPVPGYEAAYRPPLGADIRLAKWIRFSRVSRLEDDFTHALREQRSWRVDSIDAEAEKLIVTGLDKNKTPAAAPTTFFIGKDTRIWKGRGLGTLADVQSGQQILVNLTICTLYGPGRCTDVWLDAESRAAASALQLEKHRRYQREHGLAGWVESVDNKKGDVVITIFRGVDPQLYAECEPFENFRVAVAEETLRTYDQLNDNKLGPGKVERLPSGPGPGGAIKLTFRPSELLEGFRPKRYVRVWPGHPKNDPTAWKVPDLAKEERLLEQ